MVQNKTQIALAARPPRDADRTRVAILRAAQDAFATRGYRDTGVRDITAAAGVSQALVNRYFGSKERLFEEALADLLGGNRILDFPRDRFGSLIVDMLLRPESGQRNPLSTIMLASADPGARAITHRLLLALVYDPITRWLGPEKGRERAARFMLISAGLTVYCQIYALDVLTPEATPEIRDWLVREFQALVD